MSSNINIYTINNLKFHYRNQTTYKETLRCFLLLLIQSMWDAQFTASILQFFFIHKTLAQPYVPEQNLFNLLVHIVHLAID